MDFMSGAVPPAPSEIVYITESILPQFHVMDTICCTCSSVTPLAKAGTRPARDCETAKSDRSELPDRFLREMVAD
jgi:hypothetical protein